MKEGIRILGIDDSPFDKYGRQDKVLVVGVVCRGGRESSVVEGVLSTHVKKDGTDSTSRLRRMITGSRFRPQIRLILLHGTMFAGLNVVDIRKLSSGLKTPVIAVTKTKPDMERVYNALKKANARTSGKKGRTIRETVKGCGDFKRITIANNAYHIQSAGIGNDEAARLLSRFGIGSLRLAHVIGSGIVKGESSGRL